MDERVEKVLNTYLADVERELGGVSSSARREFIAEIRTHLMEEWQHSREQNTAAMLNILERFGDAREIGAEFREKNDMAPAADVSTQYPIPSVLIVVLTVVLWPIGIVLAWLSPAWQRKHKLVATLLPIIAIIALLATALPARYYYSYQGYSSHVVEREISDGSLGDIRVVQESMPGALPNVAMIFVIALVFLLIIIGNPLGSGIYLAVTMERAP